MADHHGTASIAALRTELIEARDTFLSALAAIDPARRNSPGLVGEWSARELIAHLGYWIGHATQAIHAAELGAAADFDVGADEIQARNATVARVARATDLATVEAREAASFAALLERLEGLDPALLDARLGDWGTLERGIREDGPVHYLEHADALRAIRDGE
jgi:Mycothiol maleylpyruvate isomerase N-terminal domain